jgi:DNA-binding NtrC family response regulator
LRQRKEDIPVLLDYFSRQVCSQNGWKPVPFKPDAIEALQRYSWPGNVREMRNVVERLLLLAVAGEVDRATVELALPEAQVSPATDGGSGPLSGRVAQYEREVILAELQRQKHHITNTAKALGLERSHLYKKCQALGIDMRAVRGTAPGTR